MRFKAATNELRPRSTYGTSRRVLVGDAAGHYHPLTAVGLTLGFGDALALAGGRESFDDFTVRRAGSTRGPELLAMALYEVFADHRIEAASLRQAVYRKWRTSAAARDRTMRLLACEDTSTIRPRIAFYDMVAGAVAAAVPRSGDPAAWRRARDTVDALAGRIGHCRSYATLEDRAALKVQQAPGRAPRDGLATGGVSMRCCRSSGGCHGGCRCILPSGIATPGTYIWRWPRSTRIGFARPQRR